MGQLSGMTGFGRDGGEADFGSWTWEMKSVNGRGLDVRVNVPGGFDGLDQAVKKLANNRFVRGNVQVGLRIEVADSESATVNQSALTALFTAFKERTGVTPQGDALAVLLAARGVLETGTGMGVQLRELGADDGLRAILLGSAKTALEGLASSREEEGRALFSLLSAALDEMEALHRQAMDEAANQPQLLRDRLAERLAELKAEQVVDSERLATETAILAAKADVREELDRLAAHIETGRAHLASGEAVGRKLDFLAQEMNREVNTLCSKSASLALTNAGLGLKILIDQFKEQAANVE